MSRRPNLPTAEPFRCRDRMRLAQDLLFFAYRDFTNAADVALDELGLGRAHHRALFFIGRNPGITVSDLLAILRITKQSLARVLNALVDAGLRRPGPRPRRPPPAPAHPHRQPARRSNASCSMRQRDRLARRLQAGPDAVAGFRAVMRAIMDDAARAYIDARRRGTD